MCVCVSVCLFGRVECVRLHVRAVKGSAGASSGLLSRLSMWARAGAGLIKHSHSPALSSSASPSTNHCQILLENPPPHSPCAADSVPSDIGALMMVDHCQKKLGKKVAKVRGGEGGGGVRLLWSQAWGE